MDKNGHKVRKEDSRQASRFIAIGSVAGLTLCFLAATYKEVSVPLVLYAIFGGGILGTDNVLKLLKSIFRLGDDK